MLFDPLEVKQLVWSLFNNQYIANKNKWDFTHGYTHFNGEPPPKWLVYINYRILMSTKGFPNLSPH